MYHFQNIISYFAKFVRSHDPQHVPFENSLSYLCYYSSVLLLQEPWDQHPLVSIACLVMSFHLLRSWAKLFSSCSQVLHQLTMSSIHSLHGLSLLFVLYTIPNIRVFNFLLSSILHMWPNSWSFLWIGLCSRSFSILSFSHISRFFFALSRYTGSFGNSTSQMPAVCLWSFSCMSWFHTHIARCWTLLFPIYVFCVVGDVLTFPYILYGLCYL